MHLTLQQQKAFQEKGYFRIPGAFSKQKAARMEQHIWDVLNEQGVLPNNRATWKSGQIVGFTHLRDEPAFGFDENPATTAAINEILGQELWKKPFNWGQILVSFPEPGVEWTVPYDIWHTDFDFLMPPDEIHGVLVFCFLVKVEEKSGGTGVIAGSHRLIQQFVKDQSSKDLQKMKKVRQALYKSNPWLQVLTSKDKSIDRIAYFMQSTYEVNGTSLYIEELTGNAGDVIVGHPWLLHATTNNCGTGPRMMCVHRIHKKKD